MTIMKRLVEAQEIALCVVRKWWRPAASVGVAGSIVNVGIVLPLQTHTYPDLGGLAAMIAAAGPFVVMRGIEKMKGTDENG